MHDVDGQKIAEHDRVCAIDPVENAGGDAAPAVKLLPCRETAAPDIIGLSTERTERQIVVAIALVHPPALVEKALLGREPRIKWRARKRRQMIEGGDIESVIDGEFRSLFERLGPRFTISENERAVDTNPVAPQIGERNGKAA